MFYSGVKVLLFDEDEDGDPTDNILVGVLAPKNNAASWQADA